MSSKDEVYLAYLDLCARYAHGIDKKELGTFDGIWTDEAKWNLGEGWGNHAGLVEIRKCWEILCAAFHEMHHGLMNHQVTSLDGGVIEARCDALVPAIDASGTANVTSASYADSLTICDDGQWRFVKRDVSIHFLVPWLQPPSIELESRGYAIGSA
jgi:hypothetical protein